MAIFGYHFGVTNPEIDPLPGGMIRDLYQEKKLGFKFKTKCPSATLFQTFFPGEAMLVDKNGYINRFEVAERLNDHSSMLATQLYTDLVSSWAPAKTFSLEVIKPAVNEENIANLNLTTEERQSVEAVLIKSKEARKVVTAY
jgi:hypothetical protein